MHIRKPRRALTHQDLKAMNDAWHRARTIGLPFTLQLTVNPANSDDMTVSERCSLFARIRNNYGSFARRHSFEPACLWVREVDATGMGEHMHALCHVPIRLRPALEGLAPLWCPCLGELHTNRITMQDRIASDGKRHSAYLYIAKQMTPQAAFGRNIRRVKGGTIIGKRWGCTVNLQ